MDDRVCYQLADQQARCFDEFDAIRYVVRVSGQFAPDQLASRGNAGSVTRQDSPDVHIENDTRITAGNLATRPRVLFGNAG